MKQLIFVTSNKLKFIHAEHMLKQYNIALTREHYELQELQSESGEEITRHKAEQAYAYFKQPLVVNDDSWSIPGLNGFPGPYMKSINHWLTNEDFLNLTRPLQDRRIILLQHSVYQDATGQQYFYKEIEGLLLPEARGTSLNPNETICSFDGGQHSISELKDAGKPAVSSSVQTAWHLFGEWLDRQEKAS